MRILAVVAVGALAAAGAASARPIDNGVVQIGIDAQPGSGIGHGPVTGAIPQAPSLGGSVNIGLRLLTQGPTGHEGIMAGNQLHAGWGLAFAGAQGTAAGYCDQSHAGSSCPAGVHNGPAPSCTANRCVQTSWIGGAGVVRVTHDWQTILEERNAFLVRIQVENPTTEDRANVVYRRVLDWNVEPSPQNELTELGGIMPLPPALRFLGADGSGSGDPRTPLTPGCAPGLGYITATACGRGDRGVAAEVDLGVLLAGNQRTFCMVQGAAPTKAAAEATLRRLPVEFYSLAMSDMSGGPATFFVALGCLTPPVPDVSWDPAVGCAGQGQVVFTDRSATRTLGNLLPTHVQIDFGDGGRASGAGAFVAGHTYALAGNYTVGVTAHDGHGQLATTTRTISVIDCQGPRPDLPPVLAAPHDLSVLEGDPVALVLSAHDPEHEPLMFSARGLPTGATFDTRSGAFAWIARDPDRHCMTFAVHEADNPAHADEAPLCINVRERPAPTTPTPDDPDGDRVTGIDNCPGVANPDQADSDGNGIGDACDSGSVAAETDQLVEPEPIVTDAAPADRDGDGVLDADDNCPHAANPAQQDRDRDNLGDLCDPDLDNDGVPQVDRSGALLDNCPFTPNPGQEDRDRDGVGDACAGDRDADGIADPLDNCPWIENTDQRDDDGDGTGNACTASPFLTGLPILEDDTPGTDVQSDGGAQAPARAMPTWPFWLLLGGAGGVAAASLVRERRRWLPFVLPLFTRIRKDEVLDHPVRQRILDLVEASPGLHYRALVRGVEKGKGTVEYHLRILEDHGYVRAHRAGGYVTYYPAGHSRDAMEAQSVLRTDTARRLLQAVVAAPGATVAQLAERMGISYGAVSHHVKRFEEAGLLTLDKLPGGARATPTALAWQALGGVEPLAVA